MKQFRKKDYKFRHDLGGMCVGYNMDWFSDVNEEFPDTDREYELAYEYFRNAQKKLNIGEYFSMEIFGRKIFAYRNEEGTFTK